MWVHCHRDSLKQFRIFYISHHIFLYMCIWGVILFRLKYGHQKIESVMSHVYILISIHTLFEAIHHLHTKAPSNDVNYFVEKNQQLFQWKICTDYFLLFQMDKCDLSSQYLDLRKVSKKKRICLSSKKVVKIYLEILWSKYWATLRNLFMTYILQQLLRNKNTEMLENILSKYPVIIKPGTFFAWNRWCISWNRRT